MHKLNEKETEAMSKAFNDSFEVVEVVAKSYMRDTSLTVTNWHVAIDALPGKMGVTDMDGVVERRGHFLWMESKNENEAMTTGQRILLEQLAKIPKHTVMVVRMDTRSGDIYSYSEFKHGGWVVTPADNKQFALMVQEWYAVANRNR